MGKRIGDSLYPKPSGLEANHIPKIDCQRCNSDSFGRLGRPDGA
jgi:hypothetical protein